MRAVQQGPLVVVIVDTGPVPEAVRAPRTDGHVLVIVTLVVVTIVVVSVPVSVQPVGDIIFEFLEETRAEGVVFKDAQVTWALAPLAGLSMALSVTPCPFSCPKAGMPG